MNINRNNRQKLNLQKTKGFSIVELMIAGVIGAIIIYGLIFVFETTSNMNRTQNGLARLQENGRFAIVQIKQNAEQAGYQYCLASTVAAVGTNEAVVSKPWDVYSASITSGLPTRADIISSGGQLPLPAGPADTLPYLLDTAYLIHGHECTTDPCVPALDSLGSATTFVIPDVGTSDGERVAGTDVLTFRYISGVGRPIQTLTTTTTGVAAITYVQPSQPAPVIPAGSNAVVASCDGRTAKIINLATSNATGATANINGTISADAAGLPRLFDLDSDISEMTYYVANNVVDGRDVPTLFNVVNGTNNALIEGVDRFDVLYGIKTLSGNVLVLDAAGVEGLDVTECVQGPVSGVGSIVNITGCGWRSVVFMQIHLLLNTIYDSSTSTTDPFRYSLDGEGYQTPAALSAITGLETYRMFRREFFAHITIKNY
ncbi:MAG: PilW family protein [Proteobacteria bacterium]|nr:PilW family protein [Pseudomonadota bacterium]